MYFNIRIPILSYISTRAHLPPIENQVIGWVKKSKRRFWDGVGATVDVAHCQYTVHINLNFWTVSEALFPAMVCGSGNEMGDHLEERRTFFTKASTVVVWKWAIRGIVIVKKTYLKFWPIHNYPFHLLSRLFLDPFFSHMKTPRSRVPPGIFHCANSWDSSQRALKRKYLRNSVSNKHIGKIGKAEMREKYFWRKPLDNFLIHWRIPWRGGGGGEVILSNKIGDWPHPNWRHTYVINQLQIVLICLPWNPFYTSGLCSNPNNNASCGECKNIWRGGFYNSCWTHWNLQDRCWRAWAQVIRRDPGENSRKRRWNQTGRSLANGRTPPRWFGNLSMNLKHGKWNPEKKLHTTGNEIWETYCRTLLLRTLLRIEL